MRTALGGANAEDGRQLRILLGLHQAELSVFLADAISARGYVLHCAREAADAVRMLSRGQYTLVVLDSRLVDPQSQVLAAAMSAGARVLMLTSQDVAERVRWLYEGADDCMSRPLAVSELLARIQALLRRHASAQTTPAVLEVADLRVDLFRHKVYRQGAAIDLGTREFELLAALVAARGRVVPRRILAKEVWGEGFSDGGSNRIDVAVRRLRAKIDDPFPDKLLHAVRGVGYVLKKNDGTRRS